MEINIDLTKILKVGQQVYSPIFGYGTVISTSYKEDEDNPYLICVRFSNRFLETFTKDGKYVDIDDDEYTIECVLFPSKDNRDWRKFAVSC